MRNKGHEILITSADKDIAQELLRRYDLEHIKLGATGKGLVNKVISVATLDVALFKAARDFKPDLFMGHTSIRATHVAKWLKAKSLIFADTEATIKEHMLYAPFATWVASPACFERQFGEKHIRYPGYHELAYLHPKRFTPDRAALKRAGINAGEKFYIVRFISWDATHDIGHRGFSYTGKWELIRLLRQHGRVLITSEAKLPLEFEKYRFKGDVRDMHHVMAFADMCVSEGATMCSEAAMLGVPSVLVSSLVHGYIKELRDTYGLVSTVEEEREALALLRRWLADSALRAETKAKSERMLREKVDVTDWAVDFVGKHFKLSSPQEALLA
jgi:predicted glycosyltransferase